MASSTPKKMKQTNVDGAPALQATLDALRGDNRVHALTQLLAAWNKHKSAKTAEVVERLGALIDRSLEPLDPESMKPKAFEEAWLDIAAKRRSADVTRLVSVLGAASARAMKGFFSQLADFVADPRVPWPAVQHANFYSSTGAGPTRTAAYKLALAIGDGRLAHHDLPISDTCGQVDAVVERLKKKLSPPPPHNKADSDLLDLITDQLARLEALPPPDESELLAAANDVDSASDGKSEEVLTEAILDAPADVGARLVFADLLIEREDPRGEVIALQHKEIEKGKLTGKENKLVKQLIKAHGSSWIHPLDAVVKKPRFRLGFLSGCGDIAFRTKKQRDELSHHPLWATVTHIDQHGDSAEGLILGGGLRSLEVIGTNVGTLAKLSQVSHDVPVEEVDSWVQNDDLNDWSTVAKVGSLKKLNRLKLEPRDFGERNRTVRSFGTMRIHNTHWEQRAQHYSWLLSSPLAKQLSHLTLSAAAPLGNWIDDGLPALSALQQFETYATPRYQVGGLAPAGGRRTAGSPCFVHWFLNTADGQVAEPLVLEIGWPYFKDKLREIDLIVAINLRDFPRKDVPELVVRYKGKKGKDIDLERLSDDLTPLVAKCFDRVTLPDGRVVGNKAG